VRALFFFMLGIAFRVGPASALDMKALWKSTLALICLLLLGGLTWHVFGHIVLPHAKTAGNRALMITLQQAVQRWTADHGAWPPYTEETLTAWLMGNPASLKRLQAENTLIPPHDYLATATGSPRRLTVGSAGGPVLCDAWDTPFQFDFTQPQRALLTSAGPDQHFGTEDDQRIEATAQPRAMRPNYADYLEGLHARRNRQAKLAAAAE
jgi:hypothetical protein